MAGQAMSGLRRVALVVALLNLAYFCVEFGVAWKIGSVSLLADSVDFLEDASINGLVVLAASWPVARRAFIGRFMAILLLVPAVVGLWTALEKFYSPLAPDALSLSMTGVGALLVNGFCAYLLVRHRNEGGSLAKAAFLSSRNDALANVAIIVAGLVTATLWQSIWPDIIVGLAIALLNADAAKEVWDAAGQELNA
jgi:Co/Zn/Cd efflux system component